jgi:hypothetical protein
MDGRGSDLVGHGELEFRELELGQLELCKLEQCVVELSELE